MNNAMQMIIWTNMPFSFSAVSGDIPLPSKFGSTRAGPAAIPRLSVSNTIALRESQHSDTPEVLGVPRGPPTDLLE
jgi:hypothetical protein